MIASVITGKTFIIIIGILISASVAFLAHDSCG